MAFLIANVRSDFFFIQANCIYTIPSCPKMVATKILASSKVSLVYQNGRLTLQLPYCLSHRISWRNTQAHMDVIRHCMPFDKPCSKLLTKLAEYTPYLLAKTSKYRFFTILGDKHNVVQAMPRHMGLFVPVLHRLSLIIRLVGYFRVSLFHVLYNAGTVEPFTVTPPEAVV